MKWCVNKENFLKLLQVLKVLALLVCTAAFGWKVADSYITFMAQGTGTNIEIMPINEVSKHEHRQMNSYDNWTWWVKK